MSDSWCFWKKVKKGNNGGFREKVLSSLWFYQLGKSEGHIVFYQMKMKGIYKEEGSWCKEDYVLAWWKELKGSSDVLTFSCNTWRITMQRNKWRQE